MQDAALDPTAKQASYKCTLDIRGNETLAVISDLTWAVEEWTSVNKVRLNCNQQDNRLAMSSYWFTSKADALRLLKYREVR
jgi:hypothetical protein